MQGRGAPYKRVVIPTNADAIKAALTLIGNTFHHARKLPPFDVPVIGATPSQVLPFVWRHL